MLQANLLLQHKIPLAMSGDAEYTIYAYDRFEEEKIGHNRWQRVTTIKDQSQALMQAERLFSSQLYQKIEVKQKIFHEKKGRHVAKTLRVYEKKEANNYIALGSILLLACLSAGFFYISQM